jgi:signal peptidase I
MNIRDTRRSIFDFLKTLVVAFVLAQFVMISVAQAFQVEQYSMEPNLLPHDRVLVNKFIYRFRQPRPGEIVVLKPPTDPGRNYIKRVVAVSGQRVEIRAGHVYVDGRMLPERYLSVVTAGTYGPLVVPAHQAFVLGDNRGNSEDSRAFGFVPDRNLVGEAILIYWPPERVHVLR